MTDQTRRLFFTALLGALCLAGRPVLAQSSRQAFDKAVAELQDSPDDSALRKKVIQMAQDLKTQPELPDEVAVLKGKAAYIVKNATSADDYKAAVDAYKKATLMAPWDGDLYYNQGVVEEKAGLTDAAATDFKYYLLAKPDADDREKVLARLGKLEVLQDQAKQTQQAAVVSQQNAEVNSKAKAEWESKQAASTVVIVLGVLGLCGGAVELGLGVGDTSSAGYTVSPGYSNGVLYNKAYEGKYWSNDSYTQYTNGESELRLGWIIGGVGAVVTIIGAVTSPGPFKPQTALLNVEDGKLAWGAPLMGPNDRSGGLRGTLLHAEF